MPSLDRIGLVSGALGRPVPAQRRPEPEEPLRKYQNWLPGRGTDVGGDRRAGRLRGGDPNSAEQAALDTERHAAVERGKGSMGTRLNDLSSGHKVVIMQRLHEADLTGGLLAKGGYDLLCLPAEFEPEHRCVTSIGWSDPRQESGELLWPEKVSRDDLDGLKTTLGSYRYAAQYQQRPSPAEGGVFKRSWWRYWRPAHRELPPVQVRMADGTVESIAAVSLPERFDQVVQSWDLAFKDLATSDYVVGQVWAARRADRFLLDQRRERMFAGPASSSWVQQASRRKTALGRPRAGGAEP